MDKIYDMMVAKQTARRRNKEKIVLMELATKKGFISKMFPTVWEYNTKEDLRFYLWCCELHKWIKEEHTYAMSTGFRYNIHEYFNTTLTYSLNQITDKQ